MLDFEEMVGKPLENPNVAEIQHWGWTAKFWNSFKPKVKLSETARRQTITPTMICDESGDLRELEINWFEPNEPALQWFAKMRGQETEIDKLEAEYEGLENQLVVWFRERNWRPLIRRLWIEWIRLGLANCKHRRMGCRDLKRGKRLKTRSLIF